MTFFARNLDLQIRQKYAAQKKIVRNIKGQEKKTFSYSNVFKISYSI